MLREITKMSYNDNNNGYNKIYYVIYTIAVYIALFIYNLYLLKYIFFNIYIYILGSKLVKL